MRMGQGVRTGLGHGGITCVLQTQFSSFFFTLHMLLHALHILNIFPGTQPKDSNHDSILKVP